jgi:hypothetical protein
MNLMTQKNVINTVNAAVQKCFYGKCFNSFPPLKPLYLPLYLFRFLRQIVGVMLNVAHVEKPVENPENQLDWLASSSIRERNF